MERAEAGSEALTDEYPDFVGLECPAWVDARSDPLVREPQLAAQAANTTRLHSFRAMMSPLRATCAEAWPPEAHPDDAKAVWPYFQGLAVGRW